MNSISVQELQQLRQSGENFQLIDVREAFEYETANLGGESIPMSAIVGNVDKISRDKKVIVVCSAGVRSARVIRFLEDNHHFDNLYNLEGGISAWSSEIDPDFLQY